jgi:hypothetical protein
MEFLINFQILIILLLANFLTSFNFDTKMPLYKSVVSKLSSNNNYFGYSVAQHYIKSSKTN